MAQENNDFFKFSPPPKRPDFVKLREENTPPPQPPQPPRKPPPPPENKGFSILKMLNLRGMEFNSDRKLIIAVMLLLLGESEDELLVLALVYIML